MRKTKKICVLVSLVICISVLLCSSVFGLTEYSRCPRCGYSVTTSRETKNVGEMIVTTCSHGNVGQKDVLQTAETKVITQCNRCAFYDVQTETFTYLVGHLLYS
ncbi:hypothetical protein RBG61_10515 [Paludicola sp. MB14-C6]|uniref:hypothetical protein n=1 Tax=Paludihabitans sp. MB14-C6 TaxID=3070656 RepID=UPI0027DBF092|nr:hypothetical protein [Paludicola sp. MB14-C6]WMJ22418.1 hypothetical protein RBG61_10515 [Paludicola sp. MB14-C6]